MIRERLAKVETRATILMWCVILQGVAILILSSALVDLSHATKTLSDSISTPRVFENGKNFPAFSF